jgi:hypothetical protein
MATSTYFLNLQDAPENPIERLAWLSGLDQAVKKEINRAWEDAYFEARFQGVFQQALDLKLHPKKRALAWTRHGNEARGRSVGRWNDEW